MTQFFTSGSQRIGVSALASVLPLEYSGLISFRIDGFVLLVVQRALESSPSVQFSSVHSLSRV